MISQSGSVTILRESLETEHFKNISFPSGIAEGLSPARPIPHCARSCAEKYVCSAHPGCAKLALAEKKIFFSAC